LTRPRSFRDDNGGLGNSSYPVRDRASAIAYAALKLWQRSHSRTYDMLIDPLSAPKAISEADMAAFHRLSLKLRHRDLDCMRRVLDLVARDRREVEVLDQVRADIQDAATWYRNIEQEGLRLYARAGLTYDADDNPFIC
jgi:hypothetical protein